MQYLATSMTLGQALSLAGWFLFTAIVGLAGLGTYLVRRATRAEKSFDRMQSAIAQDAAAETLRKTHVDQ